MKKLLVLLTALALPMSSFATTEMMTKLKKSDLPQAKKASCKTCHDDMPKKAKPGKLTEFGEKWKKADGDLSKLKEEKSEKSE